MTWAEAVACALASETAQRGLEDLRVGRAPSCSSRAPPAVWGPRPCSRALGATVIGTSSERNADYVRSLGAHHTTYGPGIADRVAALGAGSVTAQCSTPPGPVRLPSSSNSWTIPRTW